MRFLMKAAPQLFAAVLGGISLLVVVQPVYAAGNAFNPDTSVVGTFLYRNSNRGNDLSDPEPNGLSLDEAEVQFASAVDPYLRASAIFSVHKEVGEWVIEPEEVFVETITMPIATFKVGKFKANFGKYNSVHAHALPFIDSQLISTTLLGEEGLNGEGISASALLPATWFSEVTAQVLSAKDDPFKSTSPNGNFALVHMKNLWDLTDDLTLEWGLSGVEGPNNLKRQSQALGSDVTFKWRPSSGGKYSALVWSSEFMAGKTNVNPDGTDNLEGVKTQGGYTLLQWQAAQRWWFQGRTEYVTQLDQTSSMKTFARKNSVLVAYLPTEFSDIRLQYDHLVDQRVTPENRVLVQLNFSIGAHPAHSY